MHLRLWLAVASAIAPPAEAALTFSAGLSDDAVLQRSTAATGATATTGATAATGAKVYGFTDPSAAVSVTVSGNDGTAVSYKVPADVSARTGGGDSHPDTPPPPPHGGFVWVVALKPEAAGGKLSISAMINAVNGTATIERVTHGDVWFCSGQSNMALETY